MSQIMMLGIGGLDADLLRVYGPSLPNLRRLMLESPFLELKSTIPPEPAPAWASVYSGLNPANHGLLVKMDCLERTLPEREAFQARPFWEQAALAGKKVCVLNPLFVGSNQAMRGLTILQAQAESGEQPDTFPPLLDEPLIPPASQLTSFCNMLRTRTEQQVKTALNCFIREYWDLFFIQLDALDYVQHFLWRYSDPGDPMYPGKNEHANRILNFYQFFDQIVGHFRAILPPECVLAVVSSHGHERRCTNRLHINEWLRSQEFLVPEDQNAGLEDQQLSPLKRLLKLANWLFGAAPRSNTKTPTNHSVDEQQSVAHLVELASSSSAYGGIRLNHKLIQREGRDYEQVREKIITGLEQLSLKDSPLINWARKREQCYQGQHIERYPDILFELRSDFGVGRSLFGPLTIADSIHRLVSGTHSPQGVFLLENWPEELDIYEDYQAPSVTDIAPTILRLLDIEDETLDGCSLVYPRPVRQLI